MKKIILFFILLNILGCYALDTSSNDDVYVHGYYRKDGTYVNSHYRTKPDGIKSNNKSYKK